MGNIPNISWPQTRIDKEEQLKGEEITLEKLQRKYGTFQCRCVGLDRVGKKKYNSRVGIQTDLGDIEIQLWKELVLRCIEQAGEKALYQHYLVWTIKHDITDCSREKIEEDVLDRYILRFFDDPRWGDFIPFNRKYRPEFLANFELAKTKQLCCGYTEEVTRLWLDQLRVSELRCRRCGKTAPFSVIGGKS